MNQMTWLDQEDKVKKSIERFKMFEPSDGYYLAFSGGKDSIVIKQLAIESGVKFDSHYNLTTVDPPELVRYIKEKHSDVEIHLPSITMWDLIVKKRMPPTRMVRYCCDVLKEGGGEGRFVVTGVRWAESSKRANSRFVVELNQNRKNSIKLNNDNDEARMMVENCVIKSKHVLNPIVDWSDADVWAFIKDRNLKYCSLYDEGFERLGCIGCPLAGPDKMQIEFDRWPTYYNQYVIAFQKMINKRIKDGMTTAWTTGQEAMDWWLSKTRLEKQLEGQIEMELQETDEI